MDQVSKYFNAERSESLFFILVGIMAIAFSSYFLMRVKQPFYNGISCPFIAIALIQIIVGSTVYLRSPKDITRVNQMVSTESSKIQSEEIPRMQKVMQNFSIYKKIEIALILAGFILSFYFKPDTMIKGIGVGLTIQAVFMLLLDYFAEQRGLVYINYLQGIMEKI